LGAISGERLDGINPKAKGFSKNIIPLISLIAPKGKSLMTFLTVANYEDISDKENSKEIYQQLKDTILRFFPEIEKNIVFERSLFYEMIDGVEVNTEQHQLKRPGNTIEGISNLFITGDSVGGEGAGGDVGHTSVRACYEKIIRKSMSL
jgi:phytoene dehydrogenase-like protein